MPSDRHLKFALPALVAAAGISAAAEDGDVRAVLDLQWEIPADSPALVLGAVEDLVVDEAGIVYVLDSRACLVHVFGPTGEHRRSLGREGDGPGEFRAPGYLFLAEGGRLGVVSKRLGRVEMIDRETGAPAGSLRLAGLARPVASAGQARWLPGQEALVAVVTEAEGATFPDWTRRLLRYEVGSGVDALAPSATIGELGRCIDRVDERAEYFALWAPWEVTADGFIVVAPAWESPQIEFRDDQGRVAAHLDLEMVPGVRTAAERRRYLDLMCGGIDPATMGIDLVLADHDPCVRAIDARPGGEIWVRGGDSGSDLPAGVLRRYHVVAADRRSVRLVMLEAPGTDGLDLVRFGPGDLVVVAHGAEERIAGHYGRSAPPPAAELRIAAYRLRLETAPGPAANAPR